MLSTKYVLGIFLNFWFLGILVLIFFVDPVSNDFLSFFIVLIGREYKVFSGGKDDRRLLVTLMFSFLFRSLLMVFMFYKIFKPFVTSNRLSLPLKVKGIRGQIIV